MEEAPPVLLSMNMPHRRCVEQIHQVLRNYPGVHRVSPSPRTGMVVVRGDTRMDASRLRKHLEYHMGRTVTIVNDGGRPNMHVEPQYTPPAAYHYPPAPPADPYPYGRPASYHNPYQPPPYYRPHTRYHGLPSVFDDTIPGNACTIM